MTLRFSNHTWSSRNRRSCSDSWRTVRLRPFAGVQPVVVDVPQPRVGHVDRGKGVYPLQQLGQFFLPGLRTAGNRRTRGSSCPGRSRRWPPGLPRISSSSSPLEPSSRRSARAAAVQLPEVLLHLAEIRQQLPRRSGELLVPVPLSRGVEQIKSPASTRGDLRVDLAARRWPARPAAPPGRPRRPRPSAEAARKACPAATRYRRRLAPKALEPRRGPFRGWRRIEMRLVGARGSTCAASQRRVRPSHPGMPSPAWGRPAAARAARSARRAHRPGG